MKLRFFIVPTLIFITLMLLGSCSRQPRPNPPPPGIQKGEPLIQITPEIQYPGSTPYEDAKYEYIAPEPPEIVAKWFEDNLSGCTVERRTASIPTDTKWVVTYKDLIIDIVYGPNQTDTLIRYKKDLSKK